MTQQTSLSSAPILTCTDCQRKITNSMTADEVQDFINCADKRAIGNVELLSSSNIDGAFMFRGPVGYRGKQGIELNIWFNPDASVPKITIAYFVAGVGRIYGLCMNVSHAGMLIHKHRGVKKDDKPYHPDDITASANNPEAVWVEFCAESSLAHDGAFSVVRRGPWTPPLTEA